MFIRNSDRHVLKTTTVPKAPRKNRFYPMRVAARVFAVFAIAAAVYATVLMGLFFGGVSVF